MYSATDTISKIATPCAKRWAAVHPNAALVLILSHSDHAICAVGMATIAAAAHGQTFGTRLFEGSASVNENSAMAMPSSA